MRRPLTIVALIVAIPLSLGAGVAGGNWATGLGESERDRSAEAAERPCERAYVEVGPERLEGQRRRVTLTTVAELDQPSVMAFPPEGGAGIIGQRNGLVRTFDGRTVGEPVLDFSGDTLTTGDGGLLAAAYAPDGNHLYLYRTRADNTDVVTAHPVVAGRPSARTERIVMELDHPSSTQHHGGGLVFGPDRMLYISTGDGGGFGDPGGNAQRLDVLLGKILRIQPDPDGERPYRVPEDNPFVDRPGVRPEIFAYGLRNPYRIWFDAPTGDLWVTDVGQGCWEELNWRPGGRAAGADYEWDRREGTHEFQGGDARAGVEPVLTFSHRDGWCAVVGGFTYHGTSLRGLDGHYLFTDFCAGRVYGVRYRPGEPPRLVDVGIRTDNPIALLPGPDGEPYVLGLEGTVHRVVAPGVRRTVEPSG